MGRPTSWRKWEKRGDLHLINRIQWDERELEQMMLPFEKDWHGYGDAQKKLEKRLAEFTDIPYFHLTNSGSTAIMAGLKVLRDRGRFNVGDLVLHPVTTFPTSISSAIDYGGVPVFIGTKSGTYIVYEEKIERAIEKHPEITGMILPHLLGNIPNMERIKDSLDGRWLIEDACDTIGGYFDGKHVGSFGDFVAFSFYGSHHITTAGVGGAIGTNDEESIRLAKSIIFWGHKYYINDDKKNFKNFLNRYATETVGSDFQMSGVQAGFGLAQIDKLPGFVEARRKQFEEMNGLFRERGSEYLVLPTSDPRSKPSWFSYPLVIREDSPFTREDFINYLIENHVEIRPIMCGNILRQEPFARSKSVTLDDGKFPVADSIEEGGFFIPAWGMPEDQKEDYYAVLNKFFDCYG